MQFCCPRCQTSVAIAKDSPPDLIICPSCGHESVRLLEATVISDTEQLEDTLAYASKEKSDEQSSSSSMIGDYEVIEELARGGMGVVYRARQRSLNRIVALKMILGGQFVGEDQIQRFQTEAQAAAKLDHPSIVPVYEVGQHDGQHFLSMAFVDGTSLIQRLTDGPLPPEEAARLIQTTAEAVQFAHEHGVVHRDLKPHNILLDRQHQPRVTDFGLAKDFTVDSGVTTTGQIMGTPGYMPPEQARGMANEVCPLADVYSLGATLYHLLTGRPPFQAASSIETIRLVVDQEPVPLRSLNATIPRDLETICLKCLRKEPEKRYPTAGDMAADLGHWLSGKPIKARPVGRVERTWLWCKRRPATAASLIASVLILATVYIAYDRLQGLASVDVLMESDPTRVLEAADRVADYEFWTRPRLRKVLATDAKSPEDVRQQLHARIGLVRKDPRLASELLNELLTLPLKQMAYIEVIRDSLKPVRSEVVESCWEKLHGPFEDSIRLRAGLTLAALAPEAPDWTATDYEFIVDQWLTVDGFYQPQMLQLLRPIGVDLLDALESVCIQTTRSEAERIATARALVIFGPHDAVRLSRILPEVAPAPFAILHEQFELVSNAQCESTLSAVASQTPDEALSVPRRLRLGKRRAGAAITLLRQGVRAPLNDVLRYQNDPEALTQFVHGCKARGVTADMLRDCFYDADLQRGPLGNRRTKQDDSIMYGLLLALGEFEFSDFPLPSNSLIERVEAIYAQDPSSAVHGAAGWLLRRWGFHDQANAVDATPVPYDPTGHREWYVMKILSPSDESEGSLGDQERLYFTFMVMPAGDVVLGSPGDEPKGRLSARQDEDNQSDEKIRRVTFTHPIAVATHEMTWQQWIAMEGPQRRDDFSRQFGRELNDDEPAFGVSWVEAVRYCQWLTLAAGFTESDQCYAASDEAPRDARGRPTDWTLIDPFRRGFRLLSDSEWESVCRGGTRTAYSFGNDGELAAKYAWLQQNSQEWSHRVGQLRPNPRGLFDVHANVKEWCHDWYAEEVFDATDPFGPNAGTYRVARGGSWNFTSEYCRSSLRLGAESIYRGPDMGFRLAIVPTVINSKDVNGNANEKADHANEQNAP